MASDANLDRVTREQNLRTPKSCCQSDSRDLRVKLPHYQAEAVPHGALLEVRAGSPDSSKR